MSDKHTALVYKASLLLQLQKECKIISDLRDAQEQGSEKRAEYRHILDGLLIACDIIYDTEV